MMRHWASPRALCARSIGWAALLVLVTGSSGTPAVGEEQPYGDQAECSEGALAAVRFEPIRYDVSTSAILGSRETEVRWELSSQVSASGVSTSPGTRYCYAYVFKNAGSTPVKVSLVSHRVALSPLLEVMQDFSLVLAPGETETIQFATASAPELAVATAYNSALDEKVAKWALVSSGPISLYLPTVVHATVMPR